MINLLPEQYKKAFIAEYRMRIVVVFVGFLCLGGIAADALLLPTYVSSRQSAVGVSMNTSSSATPAAGATTTSPAILHAQLVAQTASLSQTLAVLSAVSTNTPAFTDSLPVVIGQKPAGISITGIQYTNGGNLEIRGIAATRDELAAFQTGLQNQASISAVNVPISDFASDTDIPFDMTITPN